MGFSLMNMFGLSSSVHFAHYWKLFPLHYTQVLCPYRLYTADHAYLTDLMLQWQLSHLNGLSLTATKFKPLFSVWLHLVLYREHVHFHDFVWLLLLACTTLLYNRIHMEGWKPCANRGPMCTLENFQWCAEPCFAYAAILSGRCLSLIPRWDKRKSITDLTSALWIVSLMLALKCSLLNRSLLSCLRFSLYRLGEPLTENTVS
jgi:hypothetical protein